jgi:hypothetical protein
MDDEPPFSSMPPRFGFWLCRIMHSRSLTEDPNSLKTILAAVGLTIGLTFVAVVVTITVVIACL